MEGDRAPLCICFSFFFELLIFSRTQIFSVLHCLVGFSFIRQDRPITKQAYVGCTATCAHKFVTRLHYEDFDFLFISSVFSVRHFFSPCLFYAPLQVYIKDPYMYVAETNSLIHLFHPPMNSWSFWKLLYLFMLVLMVELIWLACIMNVYSLTNPQ